ncbi:hypothetical protein LCGC14_1754700 [marine sediment metagenome]|uniref:Uncharacterized protein n=1 Tax=marine sediment metagenome TaxID=412755 RepID=A0A0F9H2X1_9ZZZZ
MKYQMEDQIMNIYLDVLKEGWPITEIRRKGEGIYIVTYLPHEPMLEDLVTMLNHTTVHEYILEPNE